MPYGSKTNSRWKMPHGQTDRFIRPLILLAGIALNILANLPK
jgi:hypothetical protein